MRRDSAPAIAAATAVARKRDPDAVVLALAADHIILDVPQFRATCLAGREAAEAGRIVTFGIKPTEPKTSYGYILPGEPIGKNGVHAVKSFVEKPDAATAARYVRDGYLWNSGNFLFRADVLLSELGAARAGDGEGDRGRGRECHQRSRLPAPAAGGFRARAAEIDRLRGDGKDRPRRGGGRRLPLVGHRQLGRAVRHHAARRGRQCRARAGGDHGCQRIAWSIPTAGSPPWSASRIWWW